MTGRDNPPPPSPERLMPAVPPQQWKMDWCSEAQKETIEWYLSNKNSWESYRDQCIHMAKSIGHESNIRVKFTQEEIGKLLGKTKYSVQQQLSKGKNGVKENGRPPSFDEGQLDLLRGFITDAFRKKQPPSYQEIHNWIYTQFNKAIPIDTLRHIIRNQLKFNRADGIPMERERVEVDPQSIDAYIDILTMAVLNVPAEFVYNFDEAGQQPWADTRKVRVVVPPEFHEKKVGIPVDRSTKRMSLLACVSADGSYTTPMIVLPRLTVDSELFSAGLTPNKVCLAEQKSGFLDATVFKYWLDHYFLPELREKRKRHNYYGRAVVIMDNFGPHEVLATYKNDNIEIVRLPAHASHLLQPLDLGLFNSQKARKTAISASTKYSSQTRELIKVMTSFYQAFTPMNIVSSFRQVGIVTRYNVRTGRTTCQVIPSAARSIPHIQHVEYNEPSHQVRLPGRRNESNAQLPLPVGLCASAPIRVIANSVRIAIESEQTPSENHEQTQRSEASTQVDNNEVDQLHPIETECDPPIPSALSDPGNESIEVQAAPIRRAKRKLTAIQARQLRQELGRPLVGSDLDLIQNEIRDDGAPTFFDPTSSRVDDVRSQIEEAEQMRQDRLTESLTSRKSRPSILRSARQSIASRPAPVSPGRQPNLGRKRRELYRMTTRADLAELERQINDVV